MYAVHNACHALRAGDCEAALVGGVNLILTVDQHMNTAKLGVLSPTSFCHTFDATADGYGRGEGAGVLYLKRLRDAIRDGDIIRATIRSSAVNTNGKVPGYGITYPNVKGQEAAVRTAYKRAGLDQNKTAYFECHGTGTAVGDPIEVRAVSNAMNDSRSPEKPLLLGAIKPNIGHSEAASGIFAIMKAALMVESGIIPGVAGLETINPEIPERSLNIKVNKNTSSWPPGFSSRRASVSSFGYGGTNGHVIVEDVRALVPQYQHGARKDLSPQDHSSSRPLLLTFSAHDKTTLTRNIEAHAKVANQYYLADLAHTLNHRRSRFTHKAFTVASEPSVDEDFDISNFKFGSSKESTTEVNFIFTGQGVQWAGVGKEAIKTFSVFRDTIWKLDRVLKGLAHPPDFTIEEQLCAPPEKSRIYTANVSQPTLVAIQIALVDLLASWNVVPSATVGHSAGEYAASYAAGLASAPEIIIAAYYRGYALERYAPSGGTMLAVGKGLDEIQAYLPHFDGKIVVACENSPSSVTLSGTTVAIKEMKVIFDTESTFARELKTGMAYHSPQMKPVAGPMVTLVSQAYQKLDFFDRQWRCPQKTMISSVTNAPITETQICPEYWASNLTSRVLFNTAVSTLVNMTGSRNIRCFLEVGPHSALAGPFKQICKGSGFNGFTYIPTLLRNQDSAHELLRAAGDLFVEGYPIDFDMVNHIGSSGGADNAKGEGLTPSPLVDLPPYQWNYEKMFWAEPRGSAELRQLSHARHDLLGSKIPGLSDHAMVWRNVLRLKDIAWLQDHKLGGSIMFPAAGHMALAIEAVRQHCEIKKVAMTGVTLRDINLKTALIIPENDPGIEIQLRLLQISSSSEKTPSYSFAVESYSNDIWSVHSEGTIAPLSSTKDIAISQASVNTNVLSQKTTGKRWNDTFRRVGFEYGPSFDRLTNIRTHEKYYRAAGQIPIAASTTSSMVDESRYILHPSTVDCLLQLCIISIHAGLYQELPWGVVPINFEEVTIMPPGQDADTIGEAVAWNNVRGNRARYFNTDSQLATPDGKIILDIKGLRTVAYEAALPPRTETDIKPLPYTGVVWKPDLTISTLEDAISIDARGGLAENAILDVIEFLSHKWPLSSVLIVDSSNELEVSKVLGRLPTTADLYLASGPSRAAEQPPNKEGERVKTVTLSEGPVDLGTINFGSQDVVVIGRHDIASLLSHGSFSSLRSLVGENGKALLLLEKQVLSKARGELGRSGFRSMEMAFQDQILIMSTPVPLTNGVAPGPDILNLVYSRQHSAAPEALTQAMADQGLEIRIKEITEVDAVADKHVVLYNPSGNILSRLEPASFESLKAIISAGASILWITSGVNEGKCTSGAMIAGFLRVAREEQKVSKLALLDIDKAETFASIARTVTAVLDPHNRTGSSVEHEYWLHNGACHVSRLVPNEDINTRMVQNEIVFQKISLPRGKPLRALLKGSEITFNPSDVFGESSILKEEIEIQVEHLECLKQDTQNDIEEPRLIMGTVTDTGSDVDHGLRNKTVAAYVANPYDTIVRVPKQMCVECRPENAKTLMSTLPDLARAMNAMQFITQSMKDQEVLLLPTSESMVQAFVKLSELRGFRLNVVKDLNSNESAVATDRENDPVFFNADDLAGLRQMMNAAVLPLTVIASDFSLLSQEIWRNIPSSGNFVLNENKQKALSTAPDVGPFNRGARFCVTTLTSRFEREPLSLGRNLQICASIVESSTNGLAPIPSAVTVNTLNEALKGTFDRFVLSYTYEKDVVKVSDLSHNTFFFGEGKMLTRN